MNRLAHWMMRLYPKGWRARYGDELDALLSDTGADTRIVTDLFRGGMRMQFKTWPFLKLAVTLGLAGLILGAGLAKLLPSEYTSKATLQITPDKISDSDAGSVTLLNHLNDEIQQTTAYVFTRATLSRIINDPRLMLYDEDRKTRPLEDVIEEMKRNIRVNFVALPGKLNGRAVAIDIIFTYSDRYKAQQALLAMVVEFQTAMKERAAAYAKGGRDNSFEVLDAAQLPLSPISPSRSTVMLGGFIFGLLIAGLWRMAQRTGFVARRFALVSVALGMAGLALVFAADRLDVIPYQYRSTASLRLRHGTREQVLALQNEAFSRTSLSTVVNDPRLMLYQDELKRMPLEDVLGMMKRHLIVTPVGDREGAVFTLSFDYPDRYKALLTANTIVAKLDWAASRLYSTTVGPSSASMLVDVLDTPNLPNGPSKPNRPAIAAAGGLWGVVIAAAIALIRRRWKPEPDFPADVVQG